MRTLEFEVEKQDLRKKRTCDYDKIQRGTEGYLKAKFEFVGADWEGTVKAASFQTLGVTNMWVLLDKKGECEIPSEVLGYSNWKVQVTGVRKGYKIVTCSVEVKQL